MSTPQSITILGGDTMIHPLYQWVNWCRREVWQHARQMRKDPYLIYVRSASLVSVEYVQGLFDPHTTTLEWITLPPLDRQPWYQGHIHDVELPSIITQCRRAAGTEPTLGMIEAAIPQHLWGGKGHV